MAKFVYKLQNVLDIKMKLETQAKTSYAVAVAKLNEEEEKLKELVAIKHRYEDEYRQMGNKKISVADLISCKQCIDHSRERIKQQNISIKTAQKNLEIARFRLSEAVKDRKIHEKLREKAFEQFLAEISETEKKEIDELVSYKYNSKDEAGDE